MLRGFAERFKPRYGLQIWVNCGGGNENEAEATAPSFFLVIDYPSNAQVLVTEMQNQPVETTEILDMTTLGQVHQKVTILKSRQRFQAGYAAEKGPSTFRHDPSP